MTVFVSTVIISHNLRMKSEFSNDDRSMPLYCGDFFELLHPVRLQKCVHQLHCALRIDGLSNSDGLVDHFQTKRSRISAFLRLRPSLEGDTYQDCNLVQYNATS